jgi:hypothetical protein
VIALRAAGSFAAPMGTTTETGPPRRGEPRFRFDLARFLGFHTLLLMANQPFPNELSQFIRNMESRHDSPAGTSKTPAGQPKSEKLNSEKLNGEKLNSEKCNKDFQAEKTKELLEQDTISKTLLGKTL